MVVLTFKYQHYLSKALKTYYLQTLRYRLENIFHVLLLLVLLFVYLNSLSNVVLFWGLVCLMTMILAKVRMFLIEPAKLKKDCRYHKDYTFIANDEEIKLQSDDLSTEIKWSMVSKVWEAKEYFFLFFDKRQYWAIPKELFSSKLEVNDFRRMILQHHQIDTGINRY